MLMEGSPRLRSRALAGQSSKTKVSFMRTRYSVILPLLTAAVASIRRMPVMPRRVFEARLKPASAASCQLLGDEETISVTRATAMVPPGCSIGCYSSGHGFSHAKLGLLVQRL